MRKRTITNIADVVFWYILYLLPLLAYLLFTLSEPGSGGAIVPLADFFNTSGFGILDNSIIFTSINATFGVNGVLPLFANNTITYLLTWFVSVFICHILVDFILFIPRLCHKFMNDVYKGE